MVILNFHAVDFAPHLFHFPLKNRGKKVFILILPQHIVTVFRAPLKVENNLPNAVYRPGVIADAIHTITFVAETSEAPKAPAPPRKKFEEADL